MMKLSTIGYEKRTLPELVQILKAAGVRVLIDIRAVAASRRAGFSKTILGTTLAESGIDYVHLRGLGTPKPGRDAARAGRIGEMRDIFTRHMAEPESMAQLSRAMEIARSRPSALLCFEADHAHCHRDIVAARIADEIGCRIEHL